MKRLVAMLEGTTRKSRKDKPHHQFVVPVLFTGVSVEPMSLCVPSPVMICMYSRDRFHRNAGVPR